MYKNFRKYSFAKMMMWGVATSLAFSQCSQKPTDTSAEVSDAAASIRVLMVGGGERHDFDTWFKTADSETLDKDVFAAVHYINYNDSILHYLPAVDVLYHTNNPPINDPNARQAIV